MASEQIKKRQHTVPRMFLSAFVVTGSKEKLFQFSRASFDSYPVSLDDVSVKKHAYTLDEDSGLPRMYLENKFAEVEGAAAAPLRKLRAGSHVSSRDKANVALLLAIQIRRTQLMLEHAAIHNAELAKPENSIKYIEQKRGRLEKRFGRIEVQNLIDRIRESGQGLKPSMSDSLTTAFNKVDQHAEAIMEMNWCLEVCPKAPHLFSSDAPVFVRRLGRPRDPYLVGIERADLDAELYAALSPSTFLVARWNNSRDSVRRITRPRVNYLNSLTGLMSHKYVFANSENRRITTLLRSVQDFHIELPDISSQILQG